MSVRHPPGVSGASMGHARGHSAHMSARHILGREECKAPDSLNVRRRDPLLIRLPVMRVVVFSGVSVTSAFGRNVLQNSAGLIGGAMFGPERPRF
jgi:hypothetical protein